MTLLAEVETRVGALDLRMRLEIHDGEVVALLGPNGAGKTTMLRAIAGLIATDSCRVELDGQMLEDSSSGRYVPTDQRSIGFVFQDYLLFPHLTVVDNVAFGLRARGQADARRRAMEWIDRVGLGSRGASKPSELSGGERQRIALARAFLKDAPILILDEPTSAVDAETEAAMLQALDRLMRGRTTFMVTHHPELFEWCDARLELEHGRLVPEIEPSLKAE